MARPYTAFDNTIPQTTYTYNYTYLPPLAMIETVPAGEGFSSRPDWIFLVALSALKVLINAIMIDIRGKQGTLQYIEELVKKLKSLAGQLGATAESNILEAFDGLRSAHAAPETLPEFKILLEAIATIFAAALTEQTVDDVFHSITQMRTPSAPATSLKDYNDLFQFIPLPAISQNFTEDSVFAAMRVAGPNPLVIERMTAPDSRFPVSEAQYQAVMGANDSFEKALAEGRLFLADYSVFNGSVNGSFPKEQKY